MAMTIRNSTPAAEPQRPPPAPVESPAKPAPERPVAAPRRPKAASKLAPFVGLGVLVDTAALPQPAAGVLASAGLRFSNVRFEAQGTFLPSAMADIGEGRTGTFNLLAGAALVCLDRPLGTFAVLGCGGYELGQIAGEGSGVSDPTEGRALWQAVRLELGTGLSVSPWFRILVRLGAAIPTQRTPFELAGLPVHETPAMTFRAGATADLTL